MGSRKKIVKLPHEENSLKGNNFSSPALEPASDSLASEVLSWST